jgi:hypothetical protein
VSKRNTPPLSSRASSTQRRHGGRSQSPNPIVGSAPTRVIGSATQEAFGFAEVGRLLCHERDRRLGDDGRV